MKANCTPALRSALAALLFALLASFIPHSLATEATLNADTSALGLVRAAIDAELRGDGAARAKLLKEAVAADPDFAPARWQSGFVKQDKEWLTLEQAAQRSSSDEIRKEYRKQRDTLIDTADNHRELARWCRRNKLPDEERVHWAHVLEFEQGDAEAIAALGLQLYNRQLMTRKQIDEAKKLAGEQLRANKTWQPQITKWRSAIARGTVRQRSGACGKLRELADPDAIPALESVLAAQSESKINDELNGLLIETLGRMGDPRATAVLLRQALLPESANVRAMAAAELKKRPMHEYVPQLIAAMPGHVSTSFQIFFQADGSVHHFHELLLEGQKADYAFSGSFSWSVPLGDRRNEGAATEMQRAKFIEARAADLQQVTDLQRGRVQFALERATGYVGVDDPNLWQKLLDESYGWQTPDEPKQRYTDAMDELSIPILFQHSCFPAGTLVTTQSGPVAIEQLKIGDRVLSQDVQSGELSFKLIQACTLRPPREMSRIMMGSESLLTTPGHPFWVLGRGWRTARQLRPGDLLHTLAGSSKVDSVEEARPAEVYNLVVSECHNYFVGAPQMLVHDNSPLEPTAIPVPGAAVVMAQ